MRTVLPWRKFAFELGMAPIEWNSFHRQRFCPRAEKKSNSSSQTVAMSGREMLELSSEILCALDKSSPRRKYRAVRAPGWYGSVYLIPGQAFVAGDSNLEVFINDRDSDAHVGAFVVGQGSLKDWQELVAKPSRKSSCLRLSIAAALAAPFLRPLNMDSFGINWFSDTSGGKILCLVVAASIAGLMGNEGLPCWADTQAGMEDLARGHRDNVMPLDELADGEHQMPLEKKSQMIAFLIARNRPRKLSRTYERNHKLANREFRIILLSSSERALGQMPALPRRSA